MIPLHCKIRRSSHVTTYQTKDEGMTLHVKMKIEEMGIRWKKKTDTVRKGRMVYDAWL